MRTPSVGDPPHLRLRALEVPLELSFHGDGATDVAAAVEEAWGWCLDDATVDGEDAEAHPPRRLRLALESSPGQPDDRSVVADLRATELGPLMDRLSPMITGLVLTERAGSMTLLHACALADPETGDTAVLFGPSGTGKTTLASALGGELAYLTDEAAAVYDDGLVLPYPKPLSVLASAGAALKEQLSPGRLGLRRADVPCRLRALIQLTRDPGHRGDPLVDELDVMEALVELVPQTSYSREMGRPLHRLAGLVEQVGGVRRVTYAESSHMLPIVRSLLAGTA